MISIKDLYYGYADRYLFEDASMHIKPGDKIGLVGRNGVGKSTLLRIINKEYQIESGTIQMAKDCKIGYLNQDLLSILSDEKIINVALEAFEEINRIQHKIDETLHQMEVNYSDDLVDRLGKFQSQFEQLGGYTIRSKGEMILEGLGFKTADLERPLSEFSGGWRMRVMLAKILLQEPNLLMLDEPTNHLDLPSIKWLEDYLIKSTAAFILVSHDRYFLNNTVNKIVEVFQRDLIEYKGNYDFYEEEKAERAELQNNAYENQQKSIRQQERFIERFKAKSTKAKQAQSKMKQLEKLERIEAVETDASDLKIRFRLTQVPGKVIVEGHHVSKAYGQQVILDDSDVTILRGDKIALIGANGLGKSTLLRMINGSEDFKGKIELGHNVSKEIFAQHQLEVLDLESDILTELMHFNSKLSETEARTTLGCFLFTNDDVFKPIKVLSGGEKSRVALAKTMVSGANFMLLDEPTNHLDMFAVSVLIEALNEYEGSFLVVSHDRHFVSGVANKIWYIEDFKLKEYPGTYAEYEEWNSKRQVKPQAKTVEKKEEKKPKEVSPNIQKDIKKLENKAAKIEKEIEDLEKQKEIIGLEMANPEVYSNAEKLAQFSIKLKEIANLIGTKTKEWEQTVEEIENC